MKNRVEGLYELLIRVATSLQAPFLLFVRLYWGVMFVQDGWGKLHNLDKVTEFFGTLGLPMPGATAAFVSGLELVGGILLAVGLGSRLIALLLTCNMLVAYITADREALGSIISDPETFYKATPYTYLFASLIVLIFGPGKWSLDALLSRKRRPMAAGAAVR